jgi:hypothetical protein
LIDLRIIAGKVPCGHRCGICLASEPVKCWQVPHWPASCRTVRLLLAQYFGGEDGGDFEHGTKFIAHFNRKALARLTLNHDIADGINQRAERFAVRASCVRQLNSFVICREDAALPKVKEELRHGVQAEGTNDVPALNWNGA